MAIGRNKEIPQGAVYHSDRGKQYTAKKTKDLVEMNGFRKSMSRPGTPSDNQPIESFWRTMEVEMPSTRHLNYKESKQVVINYIEMYYNAERLHSSIGYIPPKSF